MSVKLRECYCCHLTESGVPCDNPPEWTVWVKRDRYATFHACTEHVGAMLEDGQEHEVWPIKCDIAKEATA
mgnify:CR=1 FL=1